MMPPQESPQAGHLQGQGKEWIAQYRRSLDSFSEVVIDASLSRLSKFMMWVGMIDLLRYPKLALPHFSTVTLCPQFGHP